MYKKCMEVYSFLVLHEYIFPLDILGVVLSSKPIFYDLLFLIVEINKPTDTQISKTFINNQILNVNPNAH